MALKDRLYPCPAASPACLTPVQGDVKQAQLIPPARARALPPTSTHQHAGAKALALPQSRGPSPGVKGGRKREREEKWKGKEQGLGHCSEGKQRGHQICWMGWKLPSDHCGYLDQNAVCLHICKIFALLKGA